jgi:hypothetical protein
MGWPLTVNSTDYIELINELHETTLIPGPPGTTVNILTGSGDPADGTGADGDFYIDTDTSTIWGPKAAGTWAGTSGGVIPGTGGGGLPSWYAPGSLTASVDAVANNLTVDFSAKREWNVAVDAALDTFTFTAPTGTPKVAMSPLILRLYVSGSGTLDPDIWYSGGATNIFNWKTIPTYVPASGNSLVLYLDYDPSEGWFMWTGYAVESAALDANAEIDNQSPVTGFSYTVKNGSFYLMLTPLGTLATGTVTMPPTPVERQVVSINSTQIITSFTLNANSGQTLVGAPAALAVNTPIRFVWDRTTGGGTWWPA